MVKGVYLNNFYNIDLIKSSAQLCLAYLAACFQYSSYIVFYLYIMYQWLYTHSHAYANVQTPTDKRTSLREMEIPQNYHSSANWLGLNRKSLYSISENIWRLLNVFYKVLKKGESFRSEGSHIHIQDMHIHINTQIRAHTHTHTHTDIYIYVCVCVCVCVCIYIYIYIRVEFLKSVETESMFTKTKKFSLKMSPRHPTLLFQKYLFYISSYFFECSRRSQESCDEFSLLANKKKS